jgi:hypothetical protein
MDADRELSRSGNRSGLVTCCEMGRISCANLCHANGSIQASSKDGCSRTARASRSPRTLSKKNRAVLEQATLKKHVTIHGLRRTPPT